jgi:hypothetical protein
VRAKDHVGEAEHLVGRGEVEFDGILGNPVGVFGPGHLVLTHRWFDRAGHGDRVSLDAHAVKKT